MTDGNLDTGEGLGAPPLGERVGRGLRWSLFQQVFGRLVSFATGVVLARLLAPEDFGTYAVALAVTNVLFGLNDLGVLLAVVRWTGNVRDAARTAMTLSVGTSLVLFAACWLATPWYANTMGTPGAIGVLRLLLVTIMLDGFSSVSHGLLIREYRQSRLALAELAAMPVSVGVSIGLALSGAGAWSFAAGQVAANVVTMVLTLRWAPFWPGFGFNRAVARRLLAFGLPLAFTSLVEYALLNADYLIVGRVLGPVALGYYLLAFNMSSWPSSLVTEAVRKVSFVSFHELSNDVGRLAAAFRKAFAYMVAYALPVVLGLALLAAPLIEVVYGEDWLPAAEALRFLAVLGGARVVIALVFDLLVGVGRSRHTLLLKVLWFVVLVPALQVGATLDGIRGVALAHALVAIAWALPLFLHGASRTGVALGKLGHDSLRPALAALLAGTTVLLLPLDRWGPLVQLLAGGGAIGLVYGSLVLRRLLPARGSSGTTKKSSNLEDPSLASTP